jgi:hypothetical protein
VGDINADGRLDLCLISANDVALLIDTNLSHQASPNVFADLVHVSPFFCQDGNADAQLRPELFFLDAPNVTDFEVSVWLSDSKDLPIHEDAYSTCVIARPTLPQGGYVDTVKLPLALPAPQHLWKGNPRIFGITITPLDAGGNQAAPTTLGLFAANVLNLNPALTYPGWPPAFAIDTGVLCANPGGSGNATGGWVRGRRLPPFPPDKKPKKATGCVTPPTGGA